MPKERVERDEEDLVRLYLTDIGQYPLLTKDDEVRLAQAIEAGNAARAELEAGATTLTPARKRELRRAVRDGEDAERTFVQSNLRLVVSIAKKYQASGLPLLDLIQEGNLGLMHAVEKFDWRKGFKFSTYATWWIRQAITRGIANTGRTIRLPVHAGDTLARLQKARARLELKLGRPATLAELSAEVEMPEDKVTEALRFAAEPLVAVRAAARGRRRRARRRRRGPLGRVARSRSPPPRCCPRRSTGCSPRSTSASARSSRCASASTAASPARSKRSASTSTSPASASARSRPGRCPSCATRRPTPAPATCSPSDACPPQRRPTGAPVPRQTTRPAVPRTVSAVRSPAGCSFRAPSAPGSPHGHLRRSVRSRISSSRRTSSVVTTPTKRSSPSTTGRTSLSARSIASTASRTSQVVRP